MYFVVIGDMIGSRTLSDRQSAQNCLKKALEEVNRFYADSQMSKMDLFFLLFICHIVSDFFLQTEWIETKRISAACSNG